MIQGGQGRALRPPPRANAFRFPLVAPGSYGHLGRLSRHSIQAHDAPCGKTAESVQLPKITPHEAEQGGAPVRLNMKENDSVFGDIIYAYTRKQAIADGVLVDLSTLDPIARAFKYHVACTSTVWAIIEDANTRAHQDINGIAHDIATMAFFAIRCAKPGSQLVKFKVSIAGRTHDLKLHIGPGDDAEPVMTLMLPNED